MKSNPAPIHLKDYRPPPFQIPKVELDFILNDIETRVRSRLTMERASATSPATSLKLDGEELNLAQVALDGRVLNAEEYEVSATGLLIHKVPDRFVLEIETVLHPEKNLACEGLYRSSGMFCTQCEAESFRRITYFLDRPDVMSVYRVRVEADQKLFPILLSNGNLVSSQPLEGGRHEAVWFDPHKKPCYLFALVAGNLGCLEDSFVTRSGRKVALKIFVRHGLEERCRHALESLKLSMKWDEDTYGLEYDLDNFMIVVADDFNMGAMENKGLNIFNANYILANSKTATDSDFEAVTGVVGHEYFHNWTGNRVTCRDWFQLSLKEGLTVFRDQRFSADVGGPAVKRIDEVIGLRALQFAEDAGPMAHPIRPQSYISIDNFYTTTVYEKGAEVIRMIETILGRDQFRRGLDLYFKRHDGQAVTTEDFVAAMADASGVDLTQFRRWYDQAGTPILKVGVSYDDDAKKLTIKVRQTTPPTPAQDTKLPLHIPIHVGLIAQDGRELTSTVLQLKDAEQSFTLAASEKPVLSFLRGFSAPVRVDFPRSDDELAFLITHDSDKFSRWEAAQELAVREVKLRVADFIGGQKFPDHSALVESLATSVTDPWKDPAFAAYILRLPAEPYLAQFFSTVDVDAIYSARLYLRQAIGRRYRKELLAIYDRLMDEGCEGQDSIAYGRRALKNTVLSTLVVDENPTALALAVHQRREAETMTEELGALEALTHVAAPDREVAFQEFFDKWKDETLVVNKWLMVQAVSQRTDTVEVVRRLGSAPFFDKNNPNKIYSLYAAFGRFNQVRFHSRDGSGYGLIADQVLDIDSRNPQVASRLMASFAQWRTLASDRQEKIVSQVRRILDKPGLSSNVFEIASKTLDGIKRD